MNFFKKIFANLVFLAAFSASIYAQETAIVTNTYPSPFGFYQKLQLVQRATLPNGACTGPNEWGLIYFEFDGTTQSLKLCTDDGAGLGKWIPVTGGGAAAGTIWDRNAATQNVYLVNPNDFIGLGTNVPEFNLTLDGDGGIIAAGTLDSGKLLTTAGAGTRLIWYPRKAAFRVGHASGTGNSWDDVNIGRFSTVAGGDANIANNLGTTVVGGVQNTASGNVATIVGGSSNTASDQASFVGGGANNIASGYSSAIGGGVGNRAVGQMGVIGGGDNNSANGLWPSVVGGGDRNVVDGENASILGGRLNNISLNGKDAVIGGGQNNVAAGSASVVIGGGSFSIAAGGNPTFGNQANGNFSFIGGGQNNRANGAYSVILGGGGMEGSGVEGNMIFSDYSTIGAGRMNLINGTDSVVVGGFNNLAGAAYSTILGGNGNMASGQYSTMLGNSDNDANGVASVVTGDLNLANRDYSVVGGGQFNTAMQIGTVVDNGFSNIADGNYSWSGGRGMQLMGTAHHTFAWGFSGGSTVINNPDNFLIFPNYASNVGRVGINTSTPSVALDVNGGGRFRALPIDPGGTTVNVMIDAAGNLYRGVSSKRYKENIQPLTIDSNKVLSLRPVRFNYRSSNGKDIGLIAEDVDKIIPELVVRDTTGRPDAVQYDKVSIYLLGVVKQLKGDNDTLKQENLLLEKEVGALEKAVKKTW